mgnify:CR=1 FL=1
MSVSPTISHHLQLNSSSSASSASSTSMAVGTGQALGRLADVGHGWQTRRVRLGSAEGGSAAAEGPPQGRAAGTLRQSKRAGTELSKSGALLQVSKTLR